MWCGCVIQCAVRGELPQSLPERAGVVGRGGVVETHDVSVSTLWFAERPGAPRYWSGTWPEAGREVQTVIIDYVVDGQWFAEALADRGWGRPAPNIDWGWNGVHSPYGSGDQQQQLVRANALLPGTRTAFGSDRAGILFCSQCADEYCGLVSARVSETEGVISWTDFKYTYFEFFFEGDGREGDGMWHDDPPTAEVEFHFNSAEYRAALGHLRALIGSMPPWPPAQA